METLLNYGYQNNCNYKYELQLSTFITYFLLFFVAIIIDARFPRYRQLYQNLALKLRSAKYLD
jgi:hypothetical protein